MPVKRIVLVGHCGADTYSLRHMLSETAPQVAIESANDERTVTKLATAESLLLVNRVLDGAFTANGGIALIDVLVQKHPCAAMMLISNYADAQAAAVEAGALPGFGKNELFDPAVRERLRSVIDGDSGAT